MKYSDLFYNYITHTTLKLIRHAKEIDCITNNKPFEYFDQKTISDNNGSTLFKIYKESETNIENQYGGDQVEINIEGNKYIVDLYEEKINDPDDLFLANRSNTTNTTNTTNITNTTNKNQPKYTAIFAMPFTTKANTETILERIPENMCFSALYKTKDKLELKGIQISRGCVLQQNKQEKFREAKKQGTVILKHIIKYAQNNSFKSIELIDGSTYSCSKSMFRKSYNIPRIHTLCYLEPWYHKHGFRYVKNENNQNVKNNKEILIELKTHNLRFDILIGFIYDKIIVELLDNISSVQILNLLKSIQQIYSEKYKENICEFFKQLTYTHCDIMAMIDEDIFKSLGLKLSEAESDNLMILKLL
jgi:hypothetical protein